ncbi:MAG TPA: hypothetical protein DF383_10590 [Deltaproteobacteria bacterium]|nr:hypothetical protein [Deltaproteobacteria bacterium]
MIRDVEETGWEMSERMSLEEFKKRELSLRKRSKFNAVRCEIDGHIFDSKMEAEYYLLLKSDPEVFYIDVHPIISLPGANRYKLDFIAYRGIPDPGPHIPGFRVMGRLLTQIEPVDVKGVIKPEFRIKRKLFDQYHPLAPLVVPTKTRKGWEAVR